MQNVVGRISEITSLRNMYESDRAEFVALYGRRRVGKTFLVNEMFRNHFVFKMTGVIEGTLEDQFLAFTDAMDDYGLALAKRPDNWMEAFMMLKKALKAKMKPDEKCVIFIDELPAMDVQNSGVAKALGYFWNQWASLQPNLLLIICGSATSWMITNVVNSKGGLHGRLTCEMPIHPFCLSEVEEYLTKNGFLWNRQMVLQAYMIFGGIPYYLSLLNKHESLVQNVDRLLFSQDMLMRREYRRLFSTLYRSPEVYMKIVETLGVYQQGLTRQQLAEKLGCPNNGHLGTKLEDLVYCDLLRRLPVRGKRIKKNDAIYQLKDFFCGFFLKFARRAEVEPNYWSHHINTPEVNTWMGLTFENVCTEHVREIKHALRIDAISTLNYSWRSKESLPGAQIDIVIERADGIVNICEVKYSATKYDLGKDEYAKIKNRVKVFRDETVLRHVPWVTIIAAEGLSDGKYNDVAQSILTLDDLFQR
ncbi:MAG: ATP-binding protein [Bacteroidales bacterium]|nr:ATP-binding protein [Bacteroidales bacterium]